MQGPQARDQAETIAIRQAAVQHHGVMIAEPRHGFGIGQCRGMVDDDVLALECRLQHRGHFRFVLDQQDAHAHALSRAAGRLWQVIRIPASVDENW